ncbi:hypothetical protein F4860DRAFT_369174 [Xylaria cubensis]|nr:hypothetical protein F4860DRAFT_369174 [Xylaria cubensis]
MSDYCTWDCSFLMNLPILCLNYSFLSSCFHPTWSIAGVRLLLNLPFTGPHVTSKTHYHMTRVLSVMYVFLFEIITPP